MRQNRTITEPPDARLRCPLAENGSGWLLAATLAGQIAGKKPSRPSSATNERRLGRIAAAKSRSMSAAAVVETLDLWPHARSCEAVHSGPESHPVSERAPLIHLFFFVADPEVLGSWLPRSWCSRPLSGAGAPGFPLPSARSDQRANAAKSVRARLKKKRRQIAARRPSGSSPTIRKAARGRPPRGSRPYQIAHMPSEKPSAIGRAEAAPRDLHSPLLKPPPSACPRTDCAQPESRPIDRDNTAVTPSMVANFRTGAAGFIVLRAPRRAPRARPDGSDKPTAKSLHCRSVCPQ